VHQPARRCGGRLEAGWRADEIVLNGPGKWWPPTERAVDGLRVVFCDSVEELERLAGSGRTDGLWGVRLRIPGSRSRFGVPWTSRRISSASARRWPPSAGP
jgi:hypothetical protein